MRTIESNIHTVVCLFISSDLCCILTFLDRLSIMLHVPTWLRQAEDAIYHHVMLFIFLYALVTQCNLICVCLCVQVIWYLRGTDWSKAFLLFSCICRYATYMFEDASTLFSCMHLILTLFFVKFIREMQYWCYTESGSGMHKVHLIWSAQWFMLFPRRGAMCRAIVTYFIDKVSIWSLYSHLMITL
jgi:hypothetical protein